MTAAVVIATKLIGSAGIFAWLLAYLWDWDRRLSVPVARAISRDLADGKPIATRSADAATLSIVRECYGRERQWALMLIEVFWGSLSAFVVVTVFYFTLAAEDPLRFFVRSGAWDVEQWETLKRFVQTWLPTGLVTVFAATYGSTVVMTRFAPRIARAGPRGVLRCILLDAAIKLVLMIPATIAIYAFYAVVYGSFGGSVTVAIGAVPATLVLAASMSNPSAAYFYAALISGFPLFIVMMVRLSAGSDLIARRWNAVSKLVDVEDKPLRFLGILLATLVVVFGIATGSVLRIL